MPTHSHVTAFGGDAFDDGSAPVDDAVSSMFASFGNGEAAGDDNDDSAAVHTQRHATIGSGAAAPLAAAKRSSDDESASASESAEDSEQLPVPAAATPSRPTTTDIDNHQRLFNELFEELCE